MKRTIKRQSLAGTILLILFVLWTLLVRTVDVRPVGPEGTCVGFAAVNCRVHALTGVNMTLYTITDWLGLVPLAVCLFFAGVGFWQLVRRRSLARVDPNILILGGYYLTVICCYVLFELYPINYRPVLIEGVLEASYPSSTTLLVLAVMPTLLEQSDRRLTPPWAKLAVRGFVYSFSAFMVVGRLISGVHWLTDIIGSVLLCSGLFLLYKGAAASSLKK